MVTPEGVVWNGSTYTFTVTNTPVVTGLTVRKQWLDYYGNAENYEGTLDLKLIQWVPGDLPEHTVSIYLRCTGNGSGDGLPTQITPIEDRSWTGSGDALFSWDWNTYTAIRADGGDASFTVDVPEGVGYETYATNEGTRYWIDGGVPKGKRQYVKFTGITADSIIYITISNNLYSGIANPGTNVHQIRAVDTNPSYGPLEPTGGTKTVTLGNGGSWAQSFEISGDGLLSDSSTTLPATYTENGITKPCYYSISEDDVPPGYTLEQISTDKVQSGVLTAYNRSNTELGSLHITKTVRKNGIMDTNATGTFYYAVYDEPYDSGAEPAQTPVRTGSIQVTVFGSATVTEERLKAGKYYVYELTGRGGTPVIGGEGGIFNDGKYYEVTTTGEQAVVNENDPPTVHIINNYKTTSVMVNKIWLNNNNNTPPNGATVTFTLYKGESVEAATTEVSSIVLNGTADYNGNNHVDGEPENANAYEADDWHALWKDLPKYDQDGNLVYYVVKETGNYFGYTVSYEKTTGDEPEDKDYALDRESITNSKLLFRFDILKVEEGTTDPLPGASFTIQQVTETSNTSSPHYEGDATACNPATTGSDGKTSFEDVSPGFYEVLETQLPTGYVFTGDAAFYIKVGPTGISLLEKEITEGILSFKEAETVKVGNVTIETEGTTITFIVENSPGAALPNTGGPGTRLFTVLGSILILGAGVLLWRRRRLI